MKSFFVMSIGVLKQIFSDRLLQLLIISVVCAGFVFTLFLGESPSTVIGIIVVGGITAFIESAHYRNKK